MTITQQLAPGRGWPLPAALGLFVLAGGFLGFTALRSGRDAFGELTERHVTALAKGTAREVNGLLSKAAPLLRELASQAQAGELKVDDLEKLGHQLSARLRFQKDLAWLSYSDDDTGRFVGARHGDERSIFLNRSDPAEDGGRPKEWIVNEDGTLTRFSVDLPPYDPRSRPWYQEAIASKTIVWSEPFTFHEGKRGITAAFALRDPKRARPRGVFTADFLLADLSAYLGRVATDQPGHLFLLGRDGTVIVAPAEQKAERAEPLLRASLERIPQPLASLSVNLPVAIRTEIDEEPCFASFEVFQAAENLEWTVALIVPRKAVQPGIGEPLYFTAAAGLLMLLLALAVGGWWLAERRRAAAEAQPPTERLPPASAESPRAGTEKLKEVELPPNLHAQLQDLHFDKILTSAPRMSAGNRLVPVLQDIPIVRKLGSGAMGSVYLGWHPRFQSEVAVKVLSYILAEQEPEWVQRFYREAQVAAKIQSKHLVRVFDVNETEGLYFLIMEMVHGINVGDYLHGFKDAPQPYLGEPQALEIAIAATKGLKAAHEGGVVHRDIKPDNIMLPYQKDGKTLHIAAAKLADLGLARQEEARMSLTDARFTMGTVGYMSPEQALSFKEAGKPSDVFSMGATLYDMLRGRPPFRGTTPYQAMTATVEAPHEPLATFRGDLHAETLALIDRCLEKNPEDRFADGAALLLALEACRAKMGD